MAAGGTTCSSVQTAATTGAAITPAACSARPNCPFSMLHNQNQTVWIAVVGTDPTGNSIVQLGVVKDYNAIGITQTCLFWAIYGGVIQHYHCTGISDDDEINFYIHRDANQTHYVLDDCGVNTSDYSNCTTKNNSPTVWDHPVGQSSEEEENGACDAHTFGGSTDHERIGGPSGPILPLQGVADSDPSWTARSWGKQSDDHCTDPPYHYALHQSNPSPGLDFYDTRNAS